MVLPSFLWNFSYFSFGVMLKKLSAWSVPRLMTRHDSGLKVIYCSFNISSNLSSFSNFDWFFTRIERIDCRSLSLRFWFSTHFVFRQDGPSCVNPYLRIISLHLKNICLGSLSYTMYLFFKANGWSFLL